jgi:hypothetical protein
MNGKKIEESEGRIAKRTKFPELKKRPPPFRARPLVELAAGPRLEPPVPRLRWVSSERAEKNDLFNGLIAKTRKFQQPETPPGVELAPGQRARHVFGRARLRGKLSGIRGSYHEKVNVRELAKTRNQKPHPVLELASESKSPRRRARPWARRGTTLRAGPGCGLETNGKKLKNRRVVS